MSALRPERGAGKLGYSFVLESLMRVAPTLRRALFGGVLLIAGCAQPMAEIPAYVVFFTPNSSEIDKQAQAVIADAAKVARADTGRSLTVAGYAMPSPYGTPAADFLISRNRSQAVANALIAQGVAQSRIVQEPRGSAGGDPSIESRRVEIVLGR